jgi:hypothetical protein
MYFNKLVCVTVSHFHPSLIFEGKVLHLRVSTVRDSTSVDYPLAWKYWIKVKVTDSDKRSSLFNYVINYGLNSFKLQAPGTELTTLNFHPNLHIS